MRRHVLLSLLLLTVLLTGLGEAALAADEISLSSGYVDAEISYNPVDKWRGRLGFDIYAWISNAEVNFGINRWYQLPSFWEDPSQWTVVPDNLAIRLRTKGSLWSGGPQLTGTLGDFNMLGPVYIAGKWGANKIRGIQLQDIPFPANSKTAVYWGWEPAPEAPVAQTKTAFGYGFATEIPNFRGLNLKVYAAFRNGKVPVPKEGQGPPTIIAPDGTSQTFTHINPTGYGAEQLHLYTYEATAFGASVYWDYAFIDSEGHVIDYWPQKNLSKPPLPREGVTSYKYIVAGHGSKADWMKLHLLPYKGDMTKTVQILNVDAPLEPYHAMVGATEFTYKLAGINLSGQMGRYITVDPRQSTPKSTADFQIIKGQTSLDVLGKDVATKPLSLELEYRNIATGFTPWARSTETDSTKSGYNRIEAQRGQRGWNFTVKTTVIPENPVDVGFTYDTYTKDSKSYHSYTLSLGTKYAGYDLSNKVTSSGVTFAVSRSLQLGIPAVTKFIPKYELEFASGSTTSTLSLDSTWAIGGFRNIELDASYEVTNGSAAKTTLTAEYKSPNGWELEAGWSSDDAAAQDERYFTLYYKLSL
ncbi:MAG: hypothetical protein IMX00_07780 [Limnochordales bacterium]|nr:hypothetical protein [Limnochordales bacterium]